MPTYAFECGHCAHAFEVFLWYSQSLPSGCPSCGWGEPDFRQIYGAPLIWAYNPTTFGQQAELNARRAGKTKIGEMIQESKKKEKTLTLPEGATPLKAEDDNSPWYRSGDVPGLPKLDKPLDLDKVPDTNRYIMEGR